VEIDPRQELEVQEDSKRFTGTEEEVGDEEEGIVLFTV
jgi:hypothetical protein